MRELRRAAEEARTAYNLVQEEAGNIRVICRVRPGLPAEQAAESKARRQTAEAIGRGSGGGGGGGCGGGGDDDEVGPPFEFDAMDMARLTLVDRARYPPVKRRYRFAAALPPESTQADVFAEMEQALGRGLHSFPFPLKLSLPCPFPLNFSLR